MSYLRLTILFVFLFIAVKAYPSERFFSCDTSEHMLKQNFKDGYAYVATAIEHHGFVIQFWINTHTGSWRIAGIDDNQNSCILLNGINFTPIVEQGI